MFTKAIYLLVLLMIHEIPPRKVGIGQFTKNSFNITSYTVCMHVIKIKFNSGIRQVCMHACQINHILMKILNWDAVLCIGS